MIGTESCPVLPQERGIILFACLRIFPLSFQLINYTIREIVNSCSSNFLQRSPTFFHQMYLIDEHKQKGSWGSTHPCYVVV